MKHGRLLFFAWILTATSCGELNSIRDIEQTNTAYIRIPKSAVTKDFLNETNFNLDHKQDDVFAFGYIHRDKLESLQSNMQSNIVELDRKFSKINFDAKTLTVADGDIKTDKELKEGYHDYDALTEELERLASTYPELTELTSAGRSVQGRELWLMKISDRAAVDEDEPKLLYIANMHGDEVVGRELMIYLVRQLLEEYDSNERIRSLVNNSQIYIMPSMNPDGFERGRRENSRGYDLNRDFPDFLDDPSDSENGRQVETQHVMKLHSEHHFVLAINFHGGAVCFNLPWDTKVNNSPSARFGDDPLLSVLGREYANNNSYMSSNGGFDRGVTYGYEWYRVVGGMQDWANYYRRSTHATVELSFTKWPSSSTLETQWSRNQEALLQYLERGLRGAHLKVTNPDGELLRNVDIKVSSAYARTVQYNSGVIHKPTLPGIQAIEVSANGFKKQTININASNFEGNLDEVVLIRK